MLGVADWPRVSVGCCHSGWAVAVLVAVGCCSFCFISFRFNYVSFVVYILKGVGQSKRDGWVTGGLRLGLGWLIQSSVVQPR